MTSSNLSGSAGQADDGVAMIGKAAAQAHQAIDSAAGRVPPAVDRAAARAHGAVDGAADTMRPAAKWASERVKGLCDAQEQLMEDTREQVKASPLKAIAIALGIGFVLGKLF